MEEGSVTESTMHIGLSNFVVEPLALKMKRIVDENEKKSICQSSMQTKEGNLKVPNYNTVSEWVVTWVNNVPTETTVKASKCCENTSA